MDRNAACRAHEPIRPPNRFKIGNAYYFAEKHPLKFKQRLGLANFHDTKILPVVPWCVNRIGKQETIAEIRKRHGKPFDMVILFDILEHIPKPKEFVRELATISKYFLIKLPIEDTILHNYVLPERMKVYPSAKHPDGHLWEFSVNTVHHFAVRLGLRPEIYNFYKYSIKTIYPDHLKPRGRKGGILYELLRSAQYISSTMLPNRVSLRFFGGGGLVMLATWDPDFVLE